MGALSPPPEPEHFPVADGVESADLDSAVAFQLASQASHLTLSPSGKDAGGLVVKSLADIGRSLGVPRCPDVSHDSSGSVLDTGAQLCPKIEEHRQAEGWQDATTNTPTVPPVLGMDSPLMPLVAHELGAGAGDMAVDVSRCPVVGKQLLDLPNEVLLQILSNLEVCDLLATSRVRGLLHSTLIPFCCTGAM